MKARIKPLVGVILSITGILGGQVAPAATSSANTQTNNAKIQRLQAQAASLHEQLVDLQAQLDALQATTPAHTATAASTSDHGVPTQPTHTKPSPEHIAYHPELHHVHPAVAKQAPSPKPPITAYQQNVLEPAALNKGTPYGQHAIANLGGFAVITSPYLHPNVAYNGGDLIVNFSSINKDANVLQQRQSFQHAMHSLGFTMPKTGSLLELSGEVQGSAYSQKDFNGGHSSDINLTDAELDMQALINRWITGFITFAYDDSPTAEGNRIFNSNVYLDTAFFTFGDLDKTKWRLTAGQIYVPFGLYNSFLISNPLNKDMFRTKARPILVGYGIPGTPGLSGSLYSFVGATRTGHIEPDITERSRNDKINQYGADVNYDFHLGKLHSNWGTSYIANVADSLGMQATGLDSEEFAGFNDFSGAQVLAHRVPGLDFRGEVDISQVGLFGEYTMATRDFNQANMTFNGRGAKPSDYHLEGFYSFNAWEKPGTFAIGYDHSYQALALNVPEQQIAAVVNISFWRNTVASLELRHQINYDGDDTASGNLGPIFIPDGHTSNAVTVQFNVYF